MWELKFGVILFVMEIMAVTNTTVSKAAMAKGMSSYIFTTYTHGISVFFLLPAVFLWHRKTPLPSMGCSIIMRLLLLGTINFGCYIFLYSGILYSSPTLASAMTNLSPAFTFIVAIIFRMEVLSLSARSTMFKTIGTIVSIGGALIVTFYQGLPINIFPTPTKSSLLSLVEIEPNWVVGSLMLATSSIFLSLSYVAKTWIARDFHSEVLITLISCFFETIVAAIVTFIAEKDISVWTPNIGIEWISILVGAIEVSVVNTVNTWACKVKGPLFVVMFKPLQMIIAVIMGVSFLGDILHVGSLIGGVIIAMGFYTVMKGKAEEEVLYKVSQDDEETCPHKAPLLLNKSIEVA